MTNPLKFIALFTFLSLACQIQAGTLIYKNSEGEKKIISDITIQAMDDRRILLEIGKGTKLIPRSQMVKYYDTDVKMNLAFDDNSSDYLCTIRDIKLPAKGQSVKNKKKTTNELIVEYDINPKPNKNQSRHVKVPYIYVFVLTSGGNNGNLGRNLFAYSFPKEAKTRMRNYDEAMMLEKVIAADRPITDPFDRSLNSANNYQRKAVIPLDGINDREVLACYVVIWGKDDIVAEKEEKNSHRYNISQYWYWQGF